MKLDYVDVFYCHRYDHETPVEETLRAIDDLIRQGKILYAGVSEWSAAQIEEAVRIADKRLLDRIVVNQPVYNMFKRYIENEIIPVSEKHGIGQVVFSPLAQGILTGKYKPGLVPESSRAANESINTGIKNMLNDDVLNKVENLEKIASELDITLPSLALAWILRQPNVASALIGASKPSQIEENLKAIDVALSEDVLNKIEVILA
jgi:aryl-alcohol dehydrogenase-like predicted oxidoreductase